MANRVSSITLSGGLLAVKKITSSGAYIPTAGAKKLVFEIVGAGGGSTGAPSGSTTTDSLSGGGGSGGYAKLLVDLGTGFLEGASFQVTIGAGGTGNVSAGTQGGITMLYYRRPEGTSDLYANLGGGFPAALLAVPTATTFVKTPGGFGGTVSIGSFSPLTTLAVQQGNPGADGVCMNRIFTSGNGGNSAIGRGGLGGNVNSAGFSPDSFGGGGGGIARMAGVAGANGAGAGAPGVMIVWEYL